MQTASEGGAWGIAVLARYMIETKTSNLATYLNDFAFKGTESMTIKQLKMKLQALSNIQNVLNKAFHLNVLHMNNLIQNKIMNKTKVESGIKMANEIEKRERQFLGLPMVLIWGYIAVAIFMTGDGMEQAFLSKYIMSLGFDNSEAGNVLTVYGLVVAIASWLSGVMAEIFSPRRVMTFAFIIWMIFHVGF